MASSIYGVGVMNRYELFVDDESDPLDVFKAMEQLREEKKKAKLADKENDSVAKTKVAQNKKKIKTSPNSNVQESGKGTMVSLEKENRRNEDNNGKFEDKPARGRSPPRGENRRSKPLANRNAVRRNSNDDRRGKREFDRQSGSDKTGVKPVDKRDGAGPHNWGSHKDLIEEVEKANVEEAPMEEQIETGDKEVEETVPIEEEVKQLTLEEWKASRTNRIKPQYNIRKAGEGEDLTQWKKMYELNKKVDMEEFEEDEEYDPMNFPQRVGRQKHVRDINFYFNDNRRGGAFRGGRGGRGRRDGRQRDNNQSDGEHPPQNSTPAPKVDDERDFPSLA